MRLALTLSFLLGVSALANGIFGYAIVEIVAPKLERTQKELLETQKKLTVCETEQKHAVKQSKLEKCPTSGSDTGIYHKHLRNIIAATLEYLQVKDRKDWERLILLTAITESDGGRYTRQIKGPARSIFQNEPETERDCLKWVKIKHPELYERIKKLRVPAKLEIHEGEYNIAYGVCMTYLEYFRRNVNPKGKSIEELAVLWKKHYNTYLGKGNVRKTLNKLQAMRVKL